MRSAIERCALDLSDTVVFTEAASGAYTVTPVLAAMAGAVQVLALARSSRYGTVEDVARATIDLARKAGVADRVKIITEKRPDIIARADIVPNSGHLRPLDSATAISSACREYLWRPPISAPATSMPTKSSLAAAGSRAESEG